MNLATAFNASARQNADKTAIFWGEEDYSYATFASQSAWLAARLAADFGVKPGDRVGVWLKNCPQFVPSLFGILQADAVVVPINCFLKPDEIGFILADAGIEVYSRACPLFVPLVEEGWTDNEVVAMAVKAYLGSLKQSGIDTLILGCTHYPLLKKIIRKFMGSGVRLVDSAEETAKEVESALKNKGLISKRSNAIHSFFVTDAPERFIEVGRRFLGEKVESAVRIER